MGASAAVAEEGALQPRQVGEPLGELSLIRVIKEVRRVQQRLRLIGDRARQRRVRVTERRDADPGQEIEVLTALRVPQLDAASPEDDHRPRLIQQRLQGPLPSTFREGHFPPQRSIPGLM